MLLSKLRRMFVFVIRSQIYIKMDVATTGQLKYTIKERLDRVPFGDRRRVFKQIVEALGISDVQFRRIMNYTNGESGEAKPSQLQIIGEHLGCSVDELLQR